MVEAAKDFRRIIGIGPAEPLRFQYRVLSIDIDGDKAIVVSEVFQNGESLGEGPDDWVYERGQWWSHEEGC